MIHFTVRAMSSFEAAVVKPSLTFSRFSASSNIFSRVCLGIISSSLSSSKEIGSFFESSKTSTMFLQGVRLSLHQYLLEQPHFRMVHKKKNFLNVALFFQSSMKTIVFHLKIFKRSRKFVRSMIIYSFSSV